MTETYDWPTVRAVAVRGFGGELPHAQTEQNVLDAFQLQPTAVVRAISEVSADYQAGKVRSGWAILRKRLLQVQPASSVAVPETDDRGRDLRRAETWIRNAGIHFDRESEVADELFGHGGILAAYASEEAVRLTMLELWRQLRPRSVQVEAEALERAEKWKRDRRAVLERAEQSRAELELRAEQELQAAAAARLAERQEAPA